MKICEINPHIRFAEQLFYCSDDKTNVFVRDCRMFYVLSGNAEININNETYKLDKNSVFYCCGGSKYNITSDEGIQLLIINFDLTQEHNKYEDCFHPTPIKQNICLPTAFSCHIDNCEFFNSYIILNNASFINGMLKAVIEEFNTKTVLYKEKCSSLIKEILIELYRKNLNSSTNSTDAVDFIIKYISENFSKQISNNTLAALTGYHEYYLNRLFVKYTGTSIHKYIINMRIDEAKRLLLNTNIPIQDISEKTGFNNDTYFSNIFKNKLGVSPLKYRKKYKNII